MLCYAAIGGPGDQKTVQRGANQYSRKVAQYDDEANERASEEWIITVLDKAYTKIAVYY